MEATTPYIPVSKMLLKSDLKGLKCDGSRAICALNDHDVVWKIKEQMLAFRWGGSSSNFSPRNTLSKGMSEKWCMLIFTVRPSAVEEIQQEM